MFISVFVFVKYQRPILQCVSHWVARPLPPLPFFHFSLSEGGCHSPAFPFQRVDQLYLQDKNTNTWSHISVFYRNIYFSLSEGGCRSPAFLFQRVDQLYFKIRTLINIPIFLFLSQFILLSLRGRLPLSCFLHSKG